MTAEKKAYRTGPYEDYFAQGVQVGATLYLSGQIGIDENGDTPTGIAEQTKIAYANLLNVLTHFGAGMDNVVDETFFVTDMDELMGDAEGVYSTREAAYGGRPEVCQTLVQVAALAVPDVKIEIKCIAVL